MPSIPAPATLAPTLVALVAALLLAPSQPANADGPEGAAASSAPAGDPAELARLTAGVQARYAKITDFKARFRQKVTRRHVPRPMKRSGRVYFKRPGMMRWDYTQPDKVLYVSGDGEILWTWQPVDKLAIKLNVKESELWVALKFLVGQGDLGGDFALSLEPPLEGRSRLVLRPKSGATGSYKKVILHLDPRSFEIQRTEIVDPLDNISEITFEGIELVPLEAQNFQFTPPVGARIEDMTGGAAAPP